MNNSALYASYLVRNNQSDVKITKQPVYKKSLQVLVKNSLPQYDCVEEMANLGKLVKTSKEQRPESRAHASTGRNGRKRQNTCNNELGDSHEPAAVALRESTSSASNQTKFKHRDHALAQHETTYNDLPYSL